MKHIEKFLIVIMILTIISISGTYLSNISLARLYGVTEYGQMRLFNKGVASIFLVFRFLVHICIAVWLFVTARDNKWAWLVLGFFFGILAAIFFYLFRIYEMLRASSEVEVNPSG
jgi:apolipoprotein N-acyltransferase